MTLGLHCTIEAKKKSIQALIVKHGDFADLHPPPPQRKPLTDEEIEDVWASCEVDWDDKVNVLTLARAIEAKLRSKNHDS
jgi:hypothetical protein